MISRRAICVVCEGVATCVKAKPGYLCQPCLDDAAACALDRAIRPLMGIDDQVVGSYREGRQ